MGYIVTLWLPDKDNTIKNKFADTKETLPKNQTENLRVKIKDIMQKEFGSAVVYTIKEEGA